MIQNQQPQPQTATPPKFEIEKIRSQAIGAIDAMIKTKLISAPANYQEEIFFAFQKMSELPDIEKCDVKNIYNQLAKIFRNNLSITKNHCALMVINGKSATGKVLSMRWQYQGLLYVAKTFCNVKRVTPVLVYEGDEFSSYYDNGNLVIDHRPAFAEDAAVKGGYCVVEFYDGYIETRYLTLAEMNKRRNIGGKETVWENGRAVGKQETAFWRTWTREMYEKTLINATLKRIIETSGGTSTEGIHDDIDEPAEAPRQVVEAVAEVVEQPDPAELPVKNSETKKIQL